MPILKPLYILLLSLPIQTFAAESETNDSTAAQSQPASTQPAASQPAGGVIEGLATNSMGGGISNAKVELESLDPPQHVISKGTTGPTGEIQLKLVQPLRETMHAKVTVTKDGYAPFSQELELNPGEDLPFVDATMTGAARIRGQVRRSDDNGPVPGADIRCMSGSREIEAKTDQRGRFALENVDHGSATLVVKATGWANDRRQVEIKEEQTEVFIELKPERPILLVATRTDGKPAPELSIEAVLEPSEQWLEATTDAQGRAELKGVPATTQKITMRYNGPGYVQMSGFDKKFDLPRPRATDTAPSTFRLVEIPLEVSVAAGIHGKVVDAAGEPVLGVRVIAGREAYGYIPMTWTAQDGTYELGALPTGPNVISFQHDDHVTLIRECTLQPGQDFAMDSKLEAGQALRGRLLDESKQPIAGAWITVESWKGYTTMGMRTVSGEHGEFEFAHAPAGPMDVGISKPGFGESRETLTAGGAARDITMKKSEEPAQAGAGRAAKLKIGDAVPELTMTATDGKTYKLSDLKGKHVFIECWASWCGPCMGEVPNIKALRAGTKDQKDFIMIGINLDRDRAAFDKAIKKEGLDWLQVTGPNSGAEKAFGTLDGFGIPYMCLIGPDGKLIAQDLRGPGLSDEVKKHLKK